MNPFGNMSPEQMEAARKMMNPQTLAQMSTLINSMSDEQLSNLMRMNGMGNMSPSLFRSMYQNMAHMGGANYTPPPQNTNTERKGTLLENLNAIKEQGNNFFRAKNYREAYLKYSEVLKEMVSASDMAKKAFKDKLEDLEKTTRLNIAACHLKLGEYNETIEQCETVLEKNKCFKAYYRMGVAYKEKKKYKLSKKYLLKALDLATEKEKVDCNKTLEEVTNELDKENKESEQKPIILEEPKKEEPKEEEIKPTLKDTITPSDNSKDKLKTVEEVLKQEKQKTKKEEKKDDDDIEISTDAPSKKETPQPTYPNNTMFNRSNTMPQMPINPHDPNIQNLFSSMSDEDLNRTAEQFKSMDNATIVQMMRSQGMNMTEQDVELLKGNVNAETLKMARQNFSQSQPPSSPTSQSSQSTTSSQSVPNPQMQMPNMSSLPNLQNMDYQSMLKFLKDNPQMMKMISPQLAKMFGGKEPDPDMVMTALEKIMWICSIPGRIKNFFTSWRGICFTILLIALFIGFIYRK